MQKKINNKQTLSDEEVASVLKILSDLLEHAPWASSAFLRVLGKKLQGIYDSFEQEVETGHKPLAETAIRNQKERKPSETQQEVFVALYSSEGTNLQSWEQNLNNLPKQAVSRPIYAEEAAVKSFIRTKDKKANEGYAVIYVNQADILPTPLEKTPKDRLGTELLTLKDGALALNQLVRFVHKDHMYRYEYGRLIKITSADDD